MTVDSRTRLVELVKKHSGVDLSSDVFAEAGLSQVVATMEYLASVADAGNRLAVALERRDVPEDLAIEEAIVDYIKDLGRAVDARTAKLGVSVVREGARCFEVG